MILIAEGDAQKLGLQYEERPLSDGSAMNIQAIIPHLGFDQIVPIQDVVGLVVHLPGCLEDLRVTSEGVLKDQQILVHSSPKFRREIQEAKRLRVGISLVEALDKGLMMFAARLTKLAPGEVGWEWLEVDAPRTAEVLEFFICTAAVLHAADFWRTHLAVV